jgi:hypothetical protein
LIADLALLAADKTIETGVTTLFGRHESMGCAPFTFKSFVHVARDPGCFRRAPEFLAPLVNDYAHAIVVFDLEGSGSTDLRGNVENAIEHRLAAAGWGNRAACVVVDPEIENWVWTDSPHVGICLGWENEKQLRIWLQEHGWWPARATKPTRPKEALQAVLRMTGQPRSSALYGRLAERVSLSRCDDLAFMKMRDMLRGWFPTV